MRNETYRLNLKNDYVFKMMHYYKEETGKRIFASLVEAFTGMKAIHVQFAPTELYPQDITGKQVRLDLCAKIDTRDAVDMEMQMSHMDEVPERAGFNTALLYVNQNNKGKAYSDHANAHCIFLCSKNVYSIADVFEHHFQMMDAKTGIVLTSKMKTHIIELKKGLKKLEKAEDVFALSLQEKWILFLMEYHENREDAVMQKLMESEEIFKEAVEVLEMISKNEDMREKAFARERYLKDQAQLRYEAQQREKKAREEGFEEGFEDGIEKGIKKGIEEGVNDEKTVTIMELLQLNMDHDFIMRVARCTEEKIEAVKQTMNSQKNQ